MYCIEDLKYNKLYKKKFFLPYLKEDRKHGSAVLLLSPDYDESKWMMNYSFSMNRNLYQSYYIEKDIMYVINNKTNLLEVTHEEPKQFILEGVSEPFVETTDIFMPYNESKEDSEINDLYCRIGDSCIFFNEMYDEDIFNEVSANYSGKYKKMLYNDRLRNNKQVFNLYDTVKVDNPWIKKTYINYNKYKGLNLFIDLYYYNQSYLSRKSSMVINRSIDMYFEFFSRFINDRRIDNAGYKKKVVFVPVHGWSPLDNTVLFDFRKNVNPISVIYKKLRLDQMSLKNKFKDMDFIFMGPNGYFKFNANHVDRMTYNKFARFINILDKAEDFDESNDNEPENSPDAISNDIISTIERTKDVEIHNLTGKVTADMDEKEATKAKIVKKINDASKFSVDTDQAIDKLEEDEEMKKLLLDIGDNSDNGVNISAARSARMNVLDDKFLNKKINNLTVKEIITTSNKPKELNETNIPIQTINDEWHHMKSMNFEKEYNLEGDILKCLYSLSKNKMYPMTVLNFSSEDTSTSQDSIITYTVEFEDVDGKRFSIKFDIPKFRDNRFMRLKGNEKIFTIEMPLIPISKTDDDTAQIVTFYNKLFVMRYNTSSGKSNPYASRLMKALSKYKGTDILIRTGDNSRIANKYNLPIDYIDISGQYTSVTFKSKSLNEKVTIYFNQDEIRKIPGINPNNGLPVAITESGKVAYYDADKFGGTISQYIAKMIDVPEFIDLYNKQTGLSKATYSKVKIAGVLMPVILVLAHDIGLTKAMDMAGVKYDIVEKRSGKDIDKDFIKLKDGYIVYNNTYRAMMLMNGLKDCSTENISIKDLNNKVTWVEQLDNFGGRRRSDNLDSFKDLMFDPVTVEICNDYKLPTNYHEALIYASNLLVDNKFTSHTNISTNRYRTNEVIAALFYKILAKCYSEYAGYKKRGRKDTKLVMKRTAVTDAVLQQNTTSDLSVFQPLLEIEARNSISTKGVSGMNEERSYKLDKRGYDDSMMNIISQSTGFAKTVGINRSTTVNCNIEGGRGYFKKSNEDNMNVTNTFNMTEALSPYAITSDDPFRTNMSYIQTTKHNTPIENGVPPLITTGADSAMPYLSSDMFAFKAKEDGVIKEITSEYMIVQYNDNNSDYINLAEQTQKNSDGGFYITLQLKTDLKVGAKVKKGDILAYDKKSFSNKIGHNQVSYNLGCLAKIAALTTEDGFEDSGVCSEWLSEAMASDIVVMKPVVLSSPLTNVLYMAKKGQKIVEGEPIMIFQNSFDEDDANFLLKNLNIEDGDLNTIGTNKVMAKVTGEISDIKIYRTCEINELSDSLKKIVKDKENEVNKLKSIASKCSNAKDIYFDPTIKLDQSGKTKNLENGILIEFYMRYHDKLAVGDKCVVLNANKMVLMRVYGDEEAPYTDLRPDEHIDAITSVDSIDGRIVTSILKNGALNKLLIELQRKCCDIYGKPWKDMHEIWDMYNDKK